MLRLAIAMLMSLLLMAPAVADDALDPAASEWQAVITSQIQAFRDHDAPAALSYAGAGFQKNFADPREFFIAVMSSGYSPIMESRYHSFGPYKMVAPDTVVQEVKLTGANQVIYEAVYQLAKEPAGWRVQGVSLVKTAGLGV